MTPDGIISEVKRVLELEGKAILDCSAKLDQKEVSESLRKAVELFRSSLDQGGKIIVTGIGKSGKVGQKIAATLCSTGSLAVFLHPTEGLHGDLGMISPKDSVLALSYTGNTEELIRLLPSLKSLRVPVIGLGGNAQSKLGLGCDVWIDASVQVEACPHNLAPTTSTTLALALGDAIAVTLMQLRGFNAEAFAKFHPGGSLGRRLSWKVSDIMHHGDAVATLAPTAPMDQVVQALTSKPLGAALVVEGGRLLGIIADGDIRRALQHQQKFFSFQAKDVMTQRPVTASPDLMAAQALELMENRPRQITVLPVVDEQGNWKGLVRLHDIIRSF